MPGSGSAKSARRNSQKAKGNPKIRWPVAFLPYRRTHQTIAAINPIKPGRSSQEVNFTKFS